VRKTYPAEPLTATPGRGIYVADADPPEVPATGTIHRSRHTTMAATNAAHGSGVCFITAKQRRTSATRRASTPRKRETVRSFDAEAMGCLRKGEPRIVRPELAPNV